MCIVCSADVARTTASERVLLAVLWLLLLLLPRTLLLLSLLRQRRACARQLCLDRCKPRTKLAPLAGHVCSTCASRLVRLCIGWRAGRRAWARHAALEKVRHGRWEAYRIPTSS